jgi:hypothetical protein
LKQVLFDESNLSRFDSQNKDYCAIFPGKNPGEFMAKVANPLKSEEVTVTLNSQSMWYVDRLIETGLYGNSRAQAVAIALFDQCKSLIAQERLQQAPPVPGSVARQVESQ